MISQLGVRWHDTALQTTQRTKVIPFPPIPLKPGQSAPKVSIRSTLLILAVIVALIAMAGFILLVLTIQYHNGYIEDYNVSKYHIRKYNLPKQPTNT